MDTSNIARGFFWLLFRWTQSVDLLCNSWLHSARKESGPALGAKGINSFLTKTEKLKALLVDFVSWLSEWTFSFFLFIRGIISSVSLYCPSALPIVKIIWIKGQEWQIDKNKKPQWMKRETSLSEGYGKEFQRGQLFTKSFVFPRTNREPTGYWKHGREF